MNNVQLESLFSNVLSGGPTGEVTAILDTDWFEHSVAKFISEPQTAGLLFVALDALLVRLKRAACEPSTLQAVMPHCSSLHSAVRARACLCLAATVLHGANSSADQFGALVRGADGPVALQIVHALAEQSGDQPCEAQWLDHLVTFGVSIIQHCLSSTQLVPAALSCISSWKALTLSRMHDQHRATFDAVLGSLPAAVACDALVALLERDGTAGVALQLLCLRVVQLQQVGVTVGGVRGLAQ